jgi:hypothetical protein
VAAAAAAAARTTQHATRSDRRLHGHLTVTRFAHPLF